MVPTAGADAPAGARRVDLVVVAYVVVEALLLRPCIFLAATYAGACLLTAVAPAAVLADLDRAVGATDGRWRFGVARWLTVFLWLMVVDTS